MYNSSLYFLMHSNYFLLGFLSIILLRLLSFTSKPLNSNWCEFSNRSGIRYDDIPRQIKSLYFEILYLKIFGKHRCLWIESGIHTNYEVTWTGFHFSNFGYTKYTTLLSKDILYLLISLNIFMLLVRFSP